MIWGSGEAAPFFQDCGFPNQSYALLSAFGGSRRVVYGVAIRGTWTCVLCPFPIHGSIPRVHRSLRQEIVDPGPGTRASGNQHQGPGLHLAVSNFLVSERLDVLDDGRPKNEFRVPVFVGTSCGGIVMVPEAAPAGGPVNGPQGMPAQHLALPEHFELIYFFRAQPLE